MEFIENYFPLFLTFIGGITASYYGPKALAKIQGAQKIAEVKTEGDSQVEVEYISGMKDLVKEFRTSVNEYKLEVSALRTEIKELKNEMREKEKEHAQIIFGYELALEKKDDELEKNEIEKEELRAQIVVRDNIIATLKGERINGSNHE